MKPKPDISEFLRKAPQDLDAFLEGGAADVANRSTRGRPRKPGVRSKQKLLYLRPDTCEALRDAVYQENIGGRTPRVSESEFVERLIRERLKLDY